IAGLALRVADATLRAASPMISSARSSASRVRTSAISTSYAKPSASMRASRAAASMSARCALSRSSTAVQHLQVAQDRLATVRVRKRRGRHQVDAPPAEQSGEGLLHLRKIPKRRRLVGLELDHEVHIAVRASFAPRRRAENADLADPVLATERLQLSLWNIQPGRTSAVRGAPFAQYGFGPAAALGAGCLSENARELFVDDTGRIQAVKVLVTSLLSPQHARSREQRKLAVQRPCRKPGA